MNKRSKHLHLEHSRLRIGTLLISIALGLGLILGLTDRVFSARLSAITLLYFRGTGQNNSVLLEWATGTEFNTAGFRLVRSSSETGQYFPLDQIGFIPAEGDGIVGAEYEAVDDENVVNGQTYWYELIEIELDGTENLAGPISVIAGPSTPTPTSTSTGTATTVPSGTGNQTPTPGSSQGNSTPTATATIPAATQSTATPTRQSQDETENQPEDSGDSQTASPSSGTIAAPSNSSLSATAVNPGDTIDVAGHPGPESVDSTDSSRTRTVAEVAAYPGPNSLDPTSAPVAYPLGGDIRVLNLTPPANSEPSGASSIIGSQEAGDSKTISTANDDNRSGSSTLMLWIGFIAALLIFVSSVIGSVVYFSRQRMQGR
jgi:hypothetical protein